MLRRRRFFLKEMSVRKRRRRKKRLHFFLFSFRRRISFKQKPAASITAGSGKLMIKSKKA